MSRTTCTESGRETSSSRVQGDGDPVHEGLKSMKGPDRHRVWVPEPTKSR